MVLMVLMLTVERMVAAVGVGRARGRGGGLPLVSAMDAVNITGRVLFALLGVLILNFLSSILFLLVIFFVHFIFCQGLPFFDSLGSLFGYIIGRLLKGISPYLQKGGAQFSRRAVSLVFVFCCVQNYSKFGSNTHTLFWNTMTIDVRLRLENYFWTKIFFWSESGRRRKNIERNVLIKTKNDTLGWSFWYPPIWTSYSTVPQGAQFLSICWRNPQYNTWFTCQREHSSNDTLCVAVSLEACTRVWLAPVFTIDLSDISDFCNADESSVWIVWCCPHCKRFPLLLLGSKSWFP